MQRQLDTERERLVAHHRAELDFVQSQLTEKDEELAGKDEELAGKDWQLAGKDLQLAGMGRQLASKKRQLAGLEARLKVALRRAEQAEAAARGLQSEQPPGRQPGSDQGSTGSLNREPPARDWACAELCSCPCCSRPPFPRCLAIAACSAAGALLAPLPQAQSPPSLQSRCGRPDRTGGHSGWGTRGAQVGYAWMRRGLKPAEQPGLTAHDGRCKGAWVEGRWA